MASNTDLQEIAAHLPTATIKREFHGDSTTHERSLRVLQWNILSQGLSNPDGNFIRVKKETTAYDTRKWRILEQILIHQPDLISLEEADIYECFLQHHLPKYGYNCLFNPKSNSPCLAFQDDRDNFKGPDGILLCYRTQLFDEVQSYCHKKTGENKTGEPFFSLIELKHKPTSQNIVFVGTHMKAKISFANVRADQMRAIVQYLKEHYSAQKHIIVVGDFNGESNEPFYEIIKQAGFSSSYKTILNDKEPLFTTWKFREHQGTEQEQCRTIDYIFYKPEGFVPVAILKLPNKEDIGPNGLPSNEYPSDHLALQTIFNVIV